jgi:hypothetical protein
MIYRKNRPVGATAVLFKSLLYSHRRPSLALLCLLIGLSSAVSVQAELPTPPELTPLISPEGQSRLLDSAFKQAYWPLSILFETQKNQAYCAVASAVIVLNALGVPRPKANAYPDFPFFTQDDFFAQVDPALANPDTVAKEGMTLPQLAAVLKGFPVTVDPYFGQDLSLDRFRALLKQGVDSPTRMALVNFDRKLIHEIGGGHWSPAAAYHAPSDSILLMDVARYKYPPVWVTAPDLHQAIQTVDSTSQRSRGLILISR